MSGPCSKSRVARTCDAFDDWNAAAAERQLTEVERCCTQSAANCIDEMTRCKVSRVASALDQGLSRARLDRLHDDTGLVPDGIEGTQIVRKTHERGDTACERKQQRVPARQDLGSKSRFTVIDSGEQFRLAPGWRHAHHAF